MKLFRVFFLYYLVIFPKLKKVEVTEKSKKMERETDRGELCLVYFTGTYSKKGEKNQQGEKKKKST